MPRSSTSIRPFFTIRRNLWKGSYVCKALPQVVTKCELPKKFHYYARHLILNRICPRDVCPKLLADSSNCVFSCGSLTSAAVSVHYISDAATNFVIGFLLKRFGAKPVLTLGFY